MLAHAEGGPQPGDLEAARGLVGRLGQLAAVLRGEAAGDPQALVDGLTAGLRHRLDGGGAAFTLSLHERGFGVRGVDLGMTDLISSQLHAALWAEGLRALRLPPRTPDDEIVLLVDLLGRDWASAGGGFEAAVHALQLERAHLELLPRATVTALDAGRVDAAVRLGRLGAQLGVAPRPVELEPWLAAAPPPAPGLAAPPAAPPTASPALVGPAAAAAPIEHAIQIVEVAAQRALDGLRQGAPEAFAWVRGVAALLEPGLALDPGRVAALGATLERGLGLSDGQLEAALSAGLRVNPAPGPWVGPALSLAALQLRLGGEEGPARALRFGAQLPPGPLQQAVADALVLGLPAAAVGGLLRAAGPKELPTALRGIRRRMEPTLVVQVSARVGHEDPEVRLAALLCLREQRGPRLTALAVAALDDAALPVRLEALRYLSVHRLPEGAAAALARLGVATETDELRALVRAFVVMRRGEAVAELVPLAISGGARGRAAMTGLLDCGAPGKAAIDQLGRSHPELRADLREVLHAHKP
ncbi:MAG: hypothetical protein JNM72_21555 [Deltaproteobacteria bacterium]|nr:hypothetical protein [Deltaproteobacteria bacterium]